MENSYPLGRLVKRQIIGSDPSQRTARHRSGNRQDSSSVNMANVIMLSVSTSPNENYGTRRLQ